MDKEPRELEDETRQCYVHADEVEWGDYSAYYPDEMLQNLRAKRLFGPGGAAPRSDVLLGVLELDPGAEYPLHSHEAPEVYYVIQGTAECRFGQEEFVARTGTAIHTQPNAPHSFKNAGQDKFVAVAVWWAPGGKSEVLNSGPVLREEV